MPPIERITHWFRSLRFPTFRQLTRLPMILNTRERIALASGILACIGGITLIVTTWYLGATERRPAVGGTYVEGLVGEPHFVNPLFASANNVDDDLTPLLYSGLFRVDEHGQIVPDLAEQFVIGADQKSVTVTLRSDVRWHDGARLTADDVVFTMHLLQDQNAGSPIRASFRGVTIERTDERTVKFSIDRPFAVFLSALTVGILPEHLWSDIPPTHLALADLNLRPIGTGPYRFVGLTKDKRGSVRSYTIERYSGFHRTSPLLQTITFRFFPDLNQLTAAFNGRDVDGIGTLGAINTAAITRSDATRYPVRLPQTTALFLNQRRNAALRDHATREALNAAVDRHAIIVDVLGGAGEPVGGPLIPGFSPTADPPPATTPRCA